MKKLFSLDNPLIQFLARVGEMIIVNTLFLLSCIPVVTIGAAYTAMHKVTQNIAAESGRGVFKTYVKSFKENFKQATIAWLALLFFLFCMACNLILVISYFTGGAALVLNCILAVLTLLVLAVAVYLFPLLARYENPLKTHLINAAVLVLVKLPRTIAMLLLNLFPLLIVYFSMSAFLSTLVFWLTLGFGFVSYLCSVLLLPVFREMEAPGGPNMNIMN